MNHPVLTRKPSLSKTYCTAPFTSLVVDPNKRVRPCCSFDGSLGNLEQDSLSDILSGPQWTDVKTQVAQGETPAGCVNCFEREQATGWSVRMNHYDPLKALNEDWRTGLTQLEINSSNVCNLACTHCSPNFSSRLVQLNDKFGEEVTHFRLTPGQRVHGPNPENIVRQLGALDLRRLQEVRFKGGEPMLNHDVPAVLQYFLERDILSKVSVVLVTNGSVVNDKVLELLHHAGHVDLCISVDGLGALQDYIRRGPSDIGRIERFIATVSSLPRLRFLLNVSVMAYNVFSLDRISDWWNGFRETRPEQFPRLMFGLQVVDPAYLAVNVLQDTTRERLANHYRSLSNADYSSVIQSLTQSFAGVALHNEFVRYTRDWDRVWNADVLQVVPELALEMTLLPETGPQDRTWIRVSADAAAQADTLRQGLSLSGAGMYADTLHLYDRFLETASQTTISTSWEIRLHRAVVLGKMGDWDRSHEALYHLASASPHGTLQAMRWIGERDVDAAGRGNVLSTISKSLGTETGFVQSPSFPLLMEALAHRALDHHSEAIAIVGRALDLDPEYALAKVAQREMSAGSAEQNH